MSKDQSWYVLTHSKGVFVKETGKIETIWGSGGQIIRFHGPYVVHAWYKLTNRLLILSHFGLKLKIYQRLSKSPLHSQGYLPADFRASGEGDEFDALVLGHPHADVGAALTEGRHASGKAILFQNTGHNPENYHGKFL